MSWHVGKLLGRHSVRTAFYSKKKPTEATHGHRFNYVEGPFRTRAGAETYANIWNSGGQVTQDMAERHAASLKGGRRDPGMTARRAAVIRGANTAYEAARKAHDHKRFARGGSYSKEETRAIARAAGLSRGPTNRALEALSFHDFMTNPPDRVFGYYKKNASVGESIILWDKQSIGTVVWRGVERRPMGGRTVAIRMAGKNGFLYSGSCNLSSGTYCRLKKGKPLPGRADPRQGRSRRRR